MHSEFLKSLFVISTRSVLIDIYIYRFSLLTQGLQLDDIPGEVESEKGHKDTITN